jgi:hypothetical protein
MARSSSRLMIAVAAVGAAVSLAGLSTMTGLLRDLLSPQLSAEVHLSTFLMPAGFGLEPQVVSDFLAAELIRRAEDDVALRLTLGTVAQKKLVEIGIPRLVSSTVVRDMIRDIKPLAEVLSVGQFKMAAEVVVYNKGRENTDVVLTMPGVVMVEAGSGSATIETTSTGLTALALGDMASGEGRTLRVWLGQGAVDAGPAFNRSVLLSDARGDTGRVWMYGRGPWQGADLQAMPAMRWMVAAVLLVVLAASLLVLGFAVLLRGGRLSRV